MSRKKYDFIIQKLKGGLPKKDADRIDDFFAVLDSRIDLAPVNKLELIEHFYRAFEYYLDNGYSLSRIIRLIDPDNLGEFYRHSERKYVTLDNAAIVYPLGMKFGQMPLFRLSVNLRDNVVPEILQLAVDFTIKRFPYFSAVIKSGLFWHYLETTSNIHQVELENDIPCKPISIILRSVRSLRVLYYKKRVSIEFFHVITDGTGGMIFLKTLIGEYFRLLSKRFDYSDGVFDINEEVDERELVNEFNNVSAADDLNTFIDKSSLQLDGKLVKTNISRIIHYQLDSKQVVNVAHRYGGSVTAYLVSIMLIAARRCISRKSGLVNIQIPVNMRKFNGSKTLRNYSMYFSASKDINEISDLKDLVPDISRQIKEKGDESKMNQMMATTGKLIQMVRFVPLFLKMPIIQIIYGYLGNSIIASTLSNLGVIEVPKQLTRYIDSFDFMLAPSSPNRISCAVASFENRMRFTLSKATRNTQFEEEMYRLFLDDGLNVELEGSDSYES